MKRDLFKFYLLLGILPKIGVLNVLYMIYYRLSLKLGIRKRRFEEGEPALGDFFLSVGTGEHSAGMDSISRRDLIVNRAEKIYNGEFTFFHRHVFQVGTIPNWFYDPFSKMEINPSGRNKHWTEIDEFDLNIGDVKKLWELSRFDWVTDLVRGYMLSRESKYLTRLNCLLNDWSRSNPTNKGINWRCGQEASVRVMKLFQASVIADKTECITPTLFDFVFDHLMRINENIRYAVVQNNNHGTSEAAALYIGALWLLNQKNITDRNRLLKLTNYKKKGRSVLEERLDALILRDGTFAQKSTNYHRVVVDTMSFVLFGLRRFDAPPFPMGICDKLEKLGDWLLQMVSSGNGEVPNMGANDGAMFETLHCCSYRDFRPSLQLYYALLKNVHVWDDELLNEPLFWKKIKIDELNPLDRTKLETSIKDDEFVQLVYGDIVVRIKATQNNFRPSNDVLNLDVWYKGVNVILDTGSFSYNADTSSDFKSIKAHNTLQFGAYEPMPRISRFLNGAWVKVRGDVAVQETEAEIKWEGEYIDYRRNRHRRLLTIKKKEMLLVIEDFFVSRVKNEIKTVGFHLPFEAENLVSITCRDKEENTIDANIGQGVHSLYYMEKNEHTHLFFQLSGEDNLFQTLVKFQQ